MPHHIGCSSFVKNPIWTIVDLEQPRLRILLSNVVRSIEIWKIGKILKDKVEFEVYFQHPAFCFTASVLTCEDPTITVFSAPWDQTTLSNGKLELQIKWRDRDRDI
ncbi:unnamed protein product [Citrullus colocynthis]|uniref:Uncharacterized protein n=1 Tax=Citrullus colocynthis TaxID=252529 RepID=A0ABP0YBU1_9ROSI